MSVGDVAFSVQSLLGPSGGALAIAFGAGAAAGWAFAISTAYRSLKQQLTDQREAHEKQINEVNEWRKRDKEDCDRRIASQDDEIADLKRWVKEAGDRYTQGLERQLAQVRDSAERMTGIVNPRRKRPD